MDVWSDKKRQNQERTHPRNDKSSAGVQKDNGEKTEMVWARHEDGGRSRSLHVQRAQVTDSQKPISTVMRVCHLYSVRGQY